MASNQDDAKQVLRVDQDCETDLQALFNSVLKPDSKRPLQVPWSMRKLPDSFFNPPSTGSKSINHSRENSVDSAFGSGGSASGASVAASAVSPGPIQSAHHRAHSSPASLQQTYAVGQAQQQTHHHIKQRSYDVASKVEDNTPLPTGWEQARTPEGQLYYLNHITRTTTWEDPRKSLAAQAAAQQHQSAEQLISPHQVSESQTANNVTTTAKVNADIDLGSLPEGWEQAQTPDGEIYFINHQTRTTSWFDPRIPTHLQQATPGSATVLGQNWHGGSIAQSSPVRQQQVRLQLLQYERERLKQRQQEIRMQQELMMRGSSSDLPMDPFLTSLNEHSRQESADSGLGLGSTYSLPHTPEDFLANMDENMDSNMEVGSESHTMDSPDISSLTDNIDCTEDLVPSLNLGEEFPTVILDDDVQSLMNPPTTKSDALIWL